MAVGEGAVVAVARNLKHRLFNGHTGAASGLVYTRGLCTTSLPEIQQEPAQLLTMGSCISKVCMHCRIHLQPMVLRLKAAEGRSLG